MKGHVCLAKPTWNTWTKMHVYRTQCIWIIQGESLISNFKLKWVNHRDI